ncbi:CPBP family intramembrane glutamic endopeptidase [Paenibacillus flagellatus]|uniref:CPBP family intramembrane metalloprotease domain-containing protein n=1 Tax=Paenibacillus flagellatus TaxID=2211139 RepID=A0A2V5K3K2_9BACL|nr:CPBP family intramembrane glutamic endopeptidase [Paenibacillus flagellatus]PYI53845.1 CPBP family intramembrane metalloprotease domain-containing protein [Paenibacillus flagellatus]
MAQRQTSGLALLAVAGILLFVLTNWWPALTGREEAETIDDPHPAVEKREAASKAESYLSELTGGPVRSTSVVYQSDQLLSGYVQKERLVHAYKSRYADQVPIDFYRVELTGSDGTEYIADVHMKTGAVFGWQKRSRERASSPEEARKLAESVLRKSGASPESYQALPRDRTAPYRVVFEHRTEKVGEAKLQVAVDVRGGEATAYRVRFGIPQSHLDWVKAQDKASASMTQWNLIVSSLMGIAAVVFSILHRKRIAFVRGIVLTLLFLAIYWINNVNMFPAFKTLEAEGYDPFLSDEASVVMIVTMNVVVTIMAVVCYFSLTAGQSLWKDAGRDPWPRWRDASFGREAMSGMTRGYLLACFMLGLQSLLFFIAEKRFGMWAVNDPTGSLYNLLRPGLFPLMAWTAAISEEAIYRFFGIALFRKLLRSTFLAVLVPSMIWAFSHTQYPIYPVYTRFVEVTLLGLVFGYAFLRYGFVTALFAHAIMDSLLMSFSLIDMGGAGSAALGLFYIVSPALVGVALWWLHRTFAGRRPPPVPDDPTPAA